MDLLKFLSRFAPQAMAAGIFIGLVVPPLAEALRPCLGPSVWLLLTLSMLRIDLTQVVTQLKRPFLPIAVTIWMLVITPVLVAGALALFAFRPGIEAGMIMVAASSSLFSTPVLGAVFGLNGALLLVVLVAGTLLLPFSLPLVAFFLLSFDLGADPWELMAWMTLMVASALAAAMIIRRLFGFSRIRRTASILDGVAVILLIAFAIGVMDGLTARIFDDPVDVALITFLAFVVYGGLIIAGYMLLLVLGRRTTRQTLLSVAFISGTRNLAIILAVLPAGADPDIGLFFAVGQFPIYIMPMFLAPIFTRLLKDSQT